MSRVKRIQTFLDDYKSLNPYLKDLIKEVHKDYQNELMNEYVRVSKHPHPTEYLSHIDPRLELQGIT